MIDIKFKERNKVPRMPRIAKALTQCVQCGYCIDVCEAHERTPWESVTARGKIYYLNQLDKVGFGLVDKALGRKISVSPDFVDAMYKCTGCGNCEAVCHSNIHLVDLWEDVRAWLVQYGYGPMSAHKAMYEKIETVYNPYGEDPQKRDAWWPEGVEKTAVPDVLFFAGCTGSYRMQELASAGVTVLSRAGVTVGTMGPDEWCCTSPIIRTGARGLSPEFSRHTVETADGTGAKDMVMTCSGCYKTILNDAGKYYAKTGQNVYHFAQYVEKLISDRKLPMNNEFNVKATYHDPCHLGRHAGVYDAPRNVIKKIKGIDFVEMYRTRELSRCCGAGGGYKSQYGDNAVAIAGDRIRDAEEVGAELIITTCPFCVLNLRQGAKKIGSKIKVMDLSEILLVVTGPKIEKKPTAEEEAEDVRKIQAEKEKLQAELEAKLDAVKQAEQIKEEKVAKIKAESDMAKLRADRLKAEEEAVRIDADILPQIRAEEEEAARMALGKEKAEPVKEEPKKETSEDKSEPDDWTANETDEVYIDDYTDYSPEAMVRRAAWNKGLRCRRDYGPDKIPVAFVGGKVAVFVEPADADRTLDNKLISKGWTVLRYDENDVTDGLKEGDEIDEAVKENLKTKKRARKSRKK